MVRSMGMGMGSLKMPFGSKISKPKEKDEVEK